MGVWLMDVPITKRTKLGPQMLVAFFLVTQITVVYIGFLFMSLKIPNPNVHINTIIQSRNILFSEFIVALHS